MKHLYKDGDEARIDAAYNHLKKALHLLAKAGAVRTLDRVRSALRSAQGAKSYVHRIAEALESEENAVVRRTKAEMEKAIKCPKCGEQPLGTVEDIEGCTSMFFIDDDGKPQYGSETDVNWDGQSTRLDEETGRPLLFCHCGEEYPAPKGFEI